jgi:hypothetical protein
MSEDYYESESESGGLTPELRINISWELHKGSKIKTPCFWMGSRKMYGMPIKFIGYYIGVRELVQKHRDLLYSDIIPTVFRFHSNYDKVCLFISILESGVELNDELWKCIPTPFPKIERHLYLMTQEVRHKMAKYLTRKARNKIKERYRLFGLYLKAKNISLEREIVDTIILESLKDEVSMWGN